MIIYNVTIKVDRDSASAWLTWMHEVHIPDLMNTGLFVESKLCRLLEQDETEGLTYVAQYYCNSLKEYEQYINEHAMEMRARGNAAFGGKFAAFRTVMEIV